MRAHVFGDLWFWDHVDITFRGYSYPVLVVMDAATNLLMIGCQLNKKESSTTEAIKTIWSTWNI